MINREAAHEIAQRIEGQFGSVHAISLQGMMRTNCCVTYKR